MQGQGTLRRVLCWALLLLGPLCCGLGCGGVKHLGSKTGRNIQVVFKRQRTAGVEPERAMQAETAEFAVKNLRKISEIADASEGPALQLIPLRR